MRKDVFWCAGPRTFMDSRHRLGENRRFHLQDTLRPAHRTTQRYTPEVHNVNIQCHKNLSMARMVIRRLPTAVNGV